MRLLGLLTDSISYFPSKSLFLCLSAQHILTSELSNSNVEAIYWMLVTELIKI